MTKLVLKNDAFYPLFNELEIQAKNSGNLEKFVFWSKEVE